MGLDMYLSRRKYIGANYEHRNIHGEIKIFQGEKEIPIDFNKVSEIREAVGYWRKANQIHSWFVENVQDGEDDCGSYLVEADKLRELLDLCKRVKEDPSKADELLPTQEGFFFGDTDYDEYYYQDIDDTIELLEELLEEDKKLKEKGLWVDYEYSSSW